MTAPALEDLTARATAILRHPSRPPAGLSQLVRPRISRIPTGLGTEAARAFLGTRSASPATSATLPAYEEEGLFCPGPLRDDRVLGKQVNDAVVAWAGEVGIYRGTWTGCARATSGGS